MPAPSAREIIALRWRLRVALRVLAVLLMLAAIGLAAARVPEFRYELWFHGAGSSSAPRFLGVDWFMPPIVLAGVAVALALLGEYGTRFFVPVPRPNCPGCGYDLRTPTSDRCPECGLPLARRANDSR
ncbi:MAG: hypothetical protein ACIAS6_03290 [Phycisphaerales bacterium JB060]